MRWRERRTAVRSALEMTSTLHSGRGVPISPVTHFVLVKLHNRMRTRRTGDDMYEGNR